MTRAWKACTTVWCRLRDWELITDREDCGRCHRALATVRAYRGNGSHSEVRP